MELKQHYFSTNNLILALGFIFILGLSLLTGYISLYRMSEVTVDLDTVSRENNQRKSISAAMQENVLQRIFILQRMLTTTDPFVLDDYRMMMVEHGQQFNQHIERINSSAMIPVAERKLLEQINEAILRGEPATIEARELIIDGKTDEALRLMQNVGVPAQYQVLSSVEALKKHYESIVTGGFNAGFNDLGKIMDKQEPLMFLVLFLGLLAGTYVIRSSSHSAALISSQQGKLRLMINDQRDLIKEQEDNLAVILRTIEDSVISIDNQGKILYMNRAAEMMSGWELIDASNRDVCEVFTIDGYYEGRDCFMHLRNDTLYNDDIGYAQSVLLLSDGMNLTIEKSMTDILDQQGNVKGSVLVLRDVSEHTHMQEELSYQASHDELTGLLNRSEFNKELIMAIQQEKRSGDSNVLCYLDLDRFKIVNDTCGHTAGDEILRQVAQLFNSLLRKHDVFARVGGDEFAILLKNCSIENSVPVMQKLVDRLEHHRFVWEKEVFSVGVSIGVLGLEEDMNETDALSAADSACYLAKESSGQSIQIYEKNDTKLITQQGELQWFSRVRYALDNDKFTLFYQPIEKTDVCTSPGEAPGHFEVLLRMKDGMGGHITPGEFLPAATRYGLMPSIDRWVVNETLRWFGTHQDRLQKSVVAINLDGTTLCDEGFLGYVEDCFKQTGVDYTSVIFELTESSVISNMSAAMQFINTLKDKGCSFALDDFGTGMSSFEYLKSLPVDYLKIDGSFVKDMLNDSIDEEVVRSINAIGRSMNKRTIAEFVEDDAIRRRLLHMGIDFVQGYGIARPQPLELLAA